MKCIKWFAVIIVFAMGDVSGMETSNKNDFDYTHPDYLLEETKLAILNKNFPRALIFWHRHQIRIEQDACCCANETIKKIICNYGRSSLTYIEDHKEFTDYLDKLPKEISVKSFIEQLKWAGEETDKKRLSSPLWIKEFVTAKPIIPVKSNDIIIKSNEWDEKRVGFLAQWKKITGDQTGIPKSDK